MEGKRGGIKLSREAEHGGWCRRVVCTCVCVRVCGTPTQKHPCLFWLFDASSLLNWNCALSHVPLASTSFLEGILRNALTDRLREERTCLVVREKTKRWTSRSKAYCFFFCNDRTYFFLPHFVFCFRQCNLDLALCLQPPATKKYISCCICHLVSGQLERAEPTRDLVDVTK